MIRAIGLAVADLGSSRLLAIMVTSILITLGIFVLIACILVWLLAGTDPCGLVGLGSCPLGIGGGAIGAVGITLVSMWFLFPAVAIAVITGFSERIARAVEERHYPLAAAKARSIRPVQGLIIGLKSASRLILFNLLALPFYLLLLLVTGVGPFILFAIVNGIAFGRDLGELAAARHDEGASTRLWLKRTRGQQHFLGILVSVLFLIPFANLLAPAIGVAAGVHLFNGSFAASRSTI